MVSLLKT